MEALAPKLRSRAQTFYIEKNNQQLQRYKQFWNARVTQRQNHGRSKRSDVGVSSTHYELLQETEEQVNSGKIYFTATFDEPCNLEANPPVAVLIEDTK